jgi:hypothetical protein
MKKVLLLLTFMVFAASCKDNNLVDDIPETPEILDKDWDRIRIPDGGTALAVIGSIDDTLLVTTIYHTYVVTDKGNSIIRTKTILNTTPGLTAVQDTIYALSGEGYDPTSKTRFAGFPTRYTLDKGLTWHFLTSKSSVSQVEIGRVTTRNNITYELDYHTGPDRNGKGDSYIHQTTINKIESGVKSVLKHPIRYAQPSNLYLDSKERLYITSGNTIHATGVVIGSPTSAPAYVYVSKVPISNYSVNIVNPTGRVKI